MIPMTASEIATAVGGELHGDGDRLLSGSVETDSREISNGSIFVAMPGEVTDGHRFIRAAAEAGAALIIAERPLQDDESSLPHIVVESGLSALGALAGEVVRRGREGGDLTIIAVTGSNGKTTTKNMLQAILEQHGPTISPVKSFNNEVGGPMTMLRLEQDTRYLVLEMGASRVGDIASLIGMAKPDVGVVLKVGLAHAGEFGGVEMTERAKSEMVTELAPTGTAILNFDDERVRRMAELTDASVLWFGTENETGLRAADIETTLDGTTFTLFSDDSVSAAGLPVTLGILGEHHVMNALAALAVTRALGLDLRRAADALAGMLRAERWRMELLRPASGAIVINDAYNSSPDSARAALQTLAHLGRSSGRRSWAVIGEMAELGDVAVEEHDRLGRLVVRYGIDKLIVVGQGAKAAHIAAEAESSFGQDTVYVESATEAQELLSTLGEHDLVLVKSSLSAGLKELGDAVGEQDEE
nr:UDP-N-acetylmuramoyl-tripeptide--D-alanyl-D-alanine ligase [uncultured Agrococcus sp.]